MSELQPEVWLSTNPDVPGILVGTPVSSDPVTSSVPDRLAWLRIFADGNGQLTLVNEDRPEGPGWHWMVPE